MPASGTPTYPGRRSPAARTEQFISVSVSPYRSTMRCPVTRSIRSCSRAGSAAEPDTKSRARASARASSGSASAASARRWYIVGTPKSIVASPAKLCADGLGREASDVAKPSSEPDRAEGAKDQAVNVEERQAVDEDVLGRPLPRLGKGVEVRRDRAAGKDGAFRRTRRPGRVEDKRRRLRGGLRRQSLAAGLRVDIEAPERFERRGELGRTAP